jgi:uncharacterized protein involved in exopolysaccharide biosynthesis
MSIADFHTGDSTPVPREQRTTRVPDSYQHLADSEIGLLRIGSILLKRWRAVLFVPLLAALVTVGVSFITPVTFTATTSFVPEVRSSPRLAAGLVGLSGLASQLGVSLGSDASQSPRFYADVAVSREILERLLLSRFPAPAPRVTNVDSATLVRILATGGRNLSDSLQRGVTKLRKRVSLNVDNLTGIVTLRVDARDASLAANIANRLVAYLNEFNAQVRQSQAREKRRFVEQRAAESERDLKDAEVELRAFYENNRSWQQSPQLVFAESRLRRQVEIRQDLYVTLRREYESARIEEVNDIPVITVIDAAVPPQRRSWPNRTLLVVLAVTLGSILSALWAYGADYLERARQEDEPNYLEFTGLVTRVRHEVSGILRRGGRGSPAE